MKEEGNSLRSFPLTFIKLKWKIAWFRDWVPLACWRNINWVSWLIEFYFWTRIEGKLVVGILSLVCNWPWCSCGLNKSSCDTCTALTWTAQSNSKRPPVNQSSFLPLFLFLINFQVVSGIGTIEPLIARWFLDAPFWLKMIHIWNIWIVKDTSHQVIPHTNWRREAIIPFPKKTRIMSNILVIALSRNVFVHVTGQDKTRRT